MIKPPKLRRGDPIATISPSWGCTGAPRVLWKYRLGCERLRELGLNVVAAPNSLRGTTYLRDNPQARAEDLMWAFENPNVQAIIANIGGNDSFRLLPFLKPDVILKNPKILCGYSDVLTLHLYCYGLGLQTFYGPNLLTSIAGEEWHPYTKYWFEKTFFDNASIGLVEPSKDWSYSPENHTNKTYKKTYIPNPGYTYVQGTGRARGKLFGGHGDLLTLTLPDGTSMVRPEYFEDAILFFEDIPEFCNIAYMSDFFDRLGTLGYLQKLRGVIIGKMRTNQDFKPYADALREIISVKYGRPDMPVLAGLNFGHTSPSFILPYGAEAEVDAEKGELHIY